MSPIADAAAPFAHLDLPPVEEYQKRKVALISGTLACRVDLKGKLIFRIGITGQDGSYL